jgi:hypothetical protein
MKKRLLSRLDRAITCINAYDSDRTFNEKILEARQYAQFLTEGNSDFKEMEEIIKITDKCLSRVKHSQKEREKVVKELHSIQEKIQKKLCNSLSSM